MPKDPPANMPHLSLLFGRPGGFAPGCLHGHRRMRCSDSVRRTPGCSPLVNDDGCLKRVAGHVKGNVVLGPFHFLDLPRDGLRRSTTVLADELDAGGCDAGARIEADQ